MLTVELAVHLSTIKKERKKRIKIYFNERRENNARWSNWKHRERVSTIKTERSRSAGLGKTFYCDTKRFVHQSTNSPGNSEDRRSGWGEKIPAEMEEEGKMRLFALARYRNTARAHLTLRFIHAVA